MSQVHYSENLNQKNTFRIQHIFSFQHDMVNIYNEESETIPYNFDFKCKYEINFWIKITLLYIKNTHFCSCSVAVISVILTTLRADFKSADTLVHCKFPTMLASSDANCA